VATIRLEYAPTPDLKGKGERSENHLPQKGRVMWGGGRQWREGDSGGCCDWARPRWMRPHRGGGQKFDRMPGRPLTDRLKRGKTGTGPRVNGERNKVIIRKAELAS